MVKSISPSLWCMRNKNWCGLRSLSLRLRAGGGKEKLGTRRNPALLSIAAVLVAVICIGIGSNNVSDKLFIDFWNAF